MAIHYGRQQVAQANTLQVNVMPAPTRGVDARAPTGNMPPDVCIYTYNLMPAEYGMLLRSGYREWAIIPDLGEADGVFTLVAFTGVLPGLQDDRLFAMTNEAIWDVSVLDTPINKLSLGVTSIGAGHGVTAHYIDLAGADFLYYADAINGLFVYTASTDTWAIATGITGPNLGAVVHVMVHKTHLWLVEEGTSDAWYLPTDAALGAASVFHFGSKFPHGGRVYAMYNWSIDGGQGIDDLLVVVSSSGDVVVFEGESPDSAATWSIRGTYYIGDIPQGRRIGSEYSGDLYLLSSFGLISMSDLVRGVDTLNPAESSLSFRVARPLRQQIAQKRTLYGWEPIFIPPIGAMLILIPQDTGQTEQYLQYSLTLATEGWGFWRDVPMRAADDWQGLLYFGSADNRVFVMDVTRDEVLLTPPPDPELNGRPVEFSLLSSYQNLRAPGLHKRVQMVRADFYGPTIPAYEQQVLYDYNFDEPPAPTGNPEVLGSTWDGSLWEIAVWSRQAGSGFGEFQLKGVSGIGRTVAVALRGSSGDDLRLLSWDIMWQTGGPI